MIWTCWLCDQTHCVSSICLKDRSAELVQKAILRSQESCVDATSSDDKSYDLDLFIKGNPNCKYALKLPDFIHIPDIEANFSGYAALAYIPSSQSRSPILEVATAEWDI